MNKIKEKFDWFIAENERTGGAMYGIRCSHGFIKYTESADAARACVKEWNKKGKRFHGSRETFQSRSPLAR